MPDDRRDVASLLALCREWLPGTPVRLEPMGGGGFSGSPLWRVETTGAEAPGRAFVLKGFAGGWTRDRAEAIHRFVAALREGGIVEVPLPLPLHPPGRGSVLGDAAGGWWELIEWKPGRAVASPTPGQASAALGTLARIHAAAAARAVGVFPSPSQDEGGRGAVPAWERRRRRLAEVGLHGWERPPLLGGTALQVRIDACRAAAARTLDRHAGRSLLKRLAAIRVPPVPLQPVLRDVWQAQILFDGERVSGVVDLHASGIDTPVADVARLLGSWKAPADPLSPRHLPVADRSVGLAARWSAALHAFQAIRPLSPEETRLIDLLHIGGVIGGIDHWFRWVLIEGMTFESPPAVEARVESLLENLDSVLGQADALLQGAG